MKNIDLLDVENSSNTKHTHNNKYSHGPKRRKTKKIAKFFTILAAVFFIIFFVFTSRIIMSEDGSILGTLSIIGQLAHLGQTSDNLLKGEEYGRTNILLLGMGGQGHEGGLLTDTIMLASIVAEEKQASLLSVPRDLVVPIEGYGWKKINHVNAYAEVEEINSGGIAVSQTLSRLLDMPIDYYIRIDFEGFEKIIDDLGGITIDVVNTINDTKYPILGNEENEDFDSRFEHLYIPAGEQTMDGQLALKYARSRHSSGVEGSDFARSRRQQQVLQAVKEKILNKNMLLKPRLIAKITTTLKDNIDTNLKAWEIAKFWSIIKDIDTENITTKNLDTSLSGLLVDTITEEGAYVLQPRTGNFNEIKYLAKNILEDAPPQQRDAVTNEHPTIEIQNGTWVNGLADNTATDLEKFGFEIVRVTNAARQSHEETLILDLTYGQKMQSLEVLKEKLAAKIHYGVPDWMLAELTEVNANSTDLVQPDFIVILGRPADITKSGLANEEE